MAAPSPRRSRQEEKPNNMQQSPRSTSQSSSASSSYDNSGLSEAIDYRVEENSRGELKRYCSSSASEFSATPSCRLTGSFSTTSSISDVEWPLDSVVFESAEELARYRNLFCMAGAVSSLSATSLTSVASSTQMQEDVARHYIGVRSRRAVDKKLTPGEFFMYYDKPSGADIPASAELKIGYMNASGQIHHFPIQRFESQDETYYGVMQTDTDVKMFPSIASLVQHYHLFSNVDPASGGLETPGLPV